MTTIQHQTLGALDFSNGYAATTAQVGANQVELDVNFDDEPDEDSLAKLQPLLSDLAALEVGGRRALQADLAEGDEDGEARLYLSHHFEHFDSPTLQRMFGTEKIEDLSAARYLAAFKLNRIGIYPEDGEAALILDFSVGKEDTDYLLSVAFDAEGGVADVTLES